MRVKFYTRNGPNKPPLRPSLACATQSVRKTRPRFLAFVKRRREAVSWSTFVRVGIAKTHAIARGAGASHTRQHVRRYAEVASERTYRPRQRKSARHIRMYAHAERKIVVRPPALKNAYYPSTKRRVHSGREQALVLVTE